MGNHISSDKSTAAASITTSSVKSETSSIFKRGKRKSRQGKAKKSSGNRLGQPFITEALQDPSHSKAVRTALRWIDAKNRHDLMRLYRSTNHDAMMHFPDTGVDLPMRPFWDSMMILFTALPDLTFSFTSVKEVEPGVVLFEKYFGGGHHTGSPLEFRPHPPIPVTGAYLAGDPVDLTLKIDEDGKVKNVVADSKGKGIAGPPGFYAKAKCAYELSLQK